jgi:hypothetical protein
MRTENLCPGGSISASLEQKSLTATQAAFTYREEHQGCASSCAVTFTLDLEERACPPRNDPTCVPGPKRFEFASGAALNLDCTCE